MPRMTQATKMVLRVLLAGGGELYGREIGALTELPSGTVIPILLRLVRAGWVESRHEGVDPALVWRPARNYYKLTDEGAKLAREALEK